MLRATHSSRPARRVAIAVYGDNCIDRYVAPDAADFVGGNAVNVAAHLAARGASPDYFGITGDDPEGALVREALADQGVDCTHLSTRRGETAVSWIEVRRGERIVLGDRPGVQCPLSLAPERLKELAGYDFVHVPTFTSWNIPWREAMPEIVTELEFLARNGAFVTVDFSELQRPELAVLLGQFLGAAFISRGPDCTPAQLRETFDFFHECGVPEVVVTLGSNGSTSSDAGEAIHVPAHCVTALDTLGAGDAYIAGWLSGRAHGEKRRGCMERGTEVAAQACGYFGAWPNAAVRGAAEGTREIDDAGTTDS